MDDSRKTTRRLYNQEIAKTRIYLGSKKAEWDRVKEENGFRTDSQTVSFLMNCYYHLKRLEGAPRTAGQVLQTLSNPEMSAIRGSGTQIETAAGIDVMSPTSLSPAVSVSPRSRHTTVSAIELCREQVFMRRKLSTLQKDGEADDEFSSMKTMDDLTASGQEGTTTDDEEAEVTIRATLANWTYAQLYDLCGELGAKKGGSKIAMINGVCTLLKKRQQLTMNPKEKEITSQRNCCVPLCRNTSETILPNGKKVVLQNFPEDSDRHLALLRRLNPEQKDLAVAASRYVCTEHFENHDATLLLSILSAEASTKPTTPSKQNTVTCTPVQSQQSVSCDTYAVLTSEKDGSQTCGPDHTKETSLEMQTRMTEKSDDDSSSSTATAPSSEESSSVLSTLSPPPKKVASCRTKWNKDSDSDTDSAEEKIGTFDGFEFETLHDCDESLRSGKRLGCQGTWEEVDKTLVSRTRSSMESDNETPTVGRRDKDLIRRGVDQIKVEPESKNEGSGEDGTRAVGIEGEDVKPVLLPNGTAVLGGPPGIPQNSRIPEHPPEVMEHSLEGDVEDLKPIVLPDGSVCSVQKVMTASSHPDEHDAIRKPDKCGSIRKPDERHAVRKPDKRAHPPDQTPVLLFGSGTYRRPARDETEMLPKHSCDYCESRFASMREIGEHVEVAHFGVRFCCCYCGDRFTLRKSIRNHQLAHFGRQSSPLFRCTACPERFYTKFDLLDHILLMEHFRCRICLKLSLSVAEHIEHEARCVKPTDCRCTICHRYFSSLERLAQHLIVHTIFFDKKEVLKGKQVVKCEKCFQSFCDSSYLTVHMTKIHHVYDCKLCTETFVCPREQGYHDCTKTPSTSQKPKQIDCPLCNEVSMCKLAFRNHFKSKHPDSDSMTSRVSSDNRLSSVSKNRQTRSEDGKEMSEMDDHAVESVVEETVAVQNSHIQFHKAKVPSTELAKPKPANSSVRVGPPAKKVKVTS